MSSIRVLIVDDHPLFRDGIRALLDSLPETEPVGEASDGATAVTLAAALKPDVVLMDLQLPVMHGIEATRRIVSDDPAIAVLVLSMSDDDESVFAAMRAGARGYVLKGADHDELHRAIVAAAAGEAIFGPAVARRLMALFTAPRTRGPGSDAFPELTERELEVLELIARGDPERARSRSGSGSASRPSATTCRRSSTSCRSSIERARSSAPARPGWGSIRTSRDPAGSPDIARPGSRPTGTPAS